MWSSSFQKCMGGKGFPVTGIPGLPKTAKRKIKYPTNKALQINIRYFTITSSNYSRNAHRNHRHLNQDTLTQYSKKSHAWWGKGFVGAYCLFMAVCHNRDADRAVRAVEAVWFVLTGQHCSGRKWSQALTLKAHLPMTDFLWQGIIF